VVESLCSQHPIDVLIRRIVAATHRATESDVEQIFERVATSPFNSRFVAVPAAVQAKVYGHRRLGPREPEIVIHVLTRIFLDGQWRVGTSTDEYLADLRAATRASHVRLAVYTRRGGSMAAVIAETEVVVPAARLGAKSLPHLLVLYSADRGIIVSGYQFSEMAAVAIPGDAQWLR
jgi:hypothetical protein